MLRAYFTMRPTAIFSLNEYITEYPISEKQLQETIGLVANTTTTEKGYNAEISLQGTWGCLSYGLYKYLLCFDENSDIIEYYFAATEDLQCDYHFLTQARLINSGKIDRIVISNIYYKNQEVRTLIKKYLPDSVSIEVQI